VKYPKAYSSLLAGFDKLASRLKEIDLDSPTAAEDVLKLAVTAQTAKEKADEFRDKECEPFEKPYKEVWDMWQPLIHGFDMFHTKMRLLTMEVARRNNTVAEKLRSQAEARLDAARAAEKAGVEVLDGKVVQSTPERTLKVLRTARAELDSLPPKAETVKVEEGTAYVRTQRKWRTLDVDQVPDAYVQRLVDPVKVDMAVKNGIKEIPGIHIYEEAEPVARRARKK